MNKSSEETDNASLSEDGHDFSKLSRGLQKRADFLKEEKGVEASFASDISLGGSSVDDSCEDSVAERSDGLRKVLFWVTTNSSMANMSVGVVFDMIVTVVIDVKRR